MDLDSAIEIAKTIFNNGGVPCTPDQLAAMLKTKPASGTFRQKVTTAKSFGLVETSQGKIELTDLGFSIIDPEREKAARAKAFLNIELYRRLFDEFLGKQLPPRPVGLEHTIEKYGVSPKQRDKARQAFERSAQQAGFFEHGRERLVMPTGSDMPLDGGSIERRQSGTGGGGGNGGGSKDELQLDPLIRGLLKRMPPPPPDGDKWHPSERVRWVQTFVMNLSFLYGDTADDDVLEVTLRRVRDA